MTSSSERVFSIDRFANNFKSAIEWMLVSRHGAEIERSIRSFIENKIELESNPDSPRALKFLVELIVTQAWYYRKPSDFDEKMNAFIDKFGANFRTQQGKKELVNLVTSLAHQRIKSRVKEMLEGILRYSSIKQFTEELYKLAVQGRTIVLGEKGRDNYLRNFGYWDRIPMDRHEMRFVVRTGIYHACSANARSDPLQKASLHDALTRFCFKYLKDYTVFGIDLGSAPGIVDIFIWSFCSKKRYNICGSTPRCEKCLLKKTCLYAIVNTFIYK